MIATITFMDGDSIKVTYNESITKLERYVNFEDTNINNRFIRIRRSDDDKYVTVNLNQIKYIEWDN